jgi:hypothetical protein
MKLRAMLLIATLFGQAGTSLAEEGSFVLVGADEKGQQVEVKLDPREYAERLHAAMAMIQQSTLEAVSTRAAEPRWALKTVVVGASISGEISAGPILKLKAVPGFKLVFSDNADPALP